MATLTGRKTVRSGGNVMARSTAKHRSLLRAPPRGDKTSVTATTPQVRTIKRRKGPFTAISRDLFQYRDLLLSLLQRDLKLRYRQTLLGPTWVILQPLLGAGVFTFLFTSVADIPLPPGVPYFVFALVGLSLWTAFSQSLMRSTNSLLGSREMITKIFVPRLLMPISSVGAAVVDSAIVLSLAVLFGAALSVGLSAKLLLALPIAIGVTLQALAIGTVLSVALVRFRDVSYGVPVLTQALLFVSPILYPVAAVPDSVRGFVDANPLSFYFEALRWAVLDGAAPTAQQGVVAAAVLTVSSLVSLVVFSVLERDVSDVI